MVKQKLSIVLGALGGIILFYSIKDFVNGFMNQGVAIWVLLGGFLLLWLSPQVSKAIFKSSRGKDFIDHIAIVVVFISMYAYIGKYVEAYWYISIVLAFLLFWKAKEIARGLGAE